MYDSLAAAPEINPELVTAILEHCASNSDRTAYVVPRSELRGQPERQDESFVVVALTDIPAGEIDHVARQIGVEVRKCPDGTDVECLTLAAGSVAISGRTIQVAGASTNSQLLVAWLFADNAVELSEYALSPEDMADLQAASQIAQSHADVALEETAKFKDAKKSVIEIFEHVVVSVKPSP
ncbi:hypothetical protein [Paraburkholderia sp. GAS42]|uniref:hypothetical protein n=1 Tax=Paraburkholderia sp. GAS42 TaxID=3035135 RepID=UPI003D1C51BE